MRRSVAFILLIPSLVGQTPDEQRNALRVLEKRAVRFATEAPRYAGQEHLVQTVRERNRRGEVKEKRREVVSEYGFLLAEPGSVVELRQVLSVDGKRVRIREKGLEHLAAALLAADDGSRRKLLEQFEKHGLRGAVRDVAQLILLFQPARIEKFEFRFAGRAEIAGVESRVYEFQQIDGPETFTVYRKDGPVRRPLRGSVWFRAFDHEPLRIAVRSEFEDRRQRIRIASSVDYDAAGLPSVVLHTESVNGVPFIRNEYKYSGFRLLK